MESPSRIATLAGRLGLAGAAAFVLGPAAIQVGMLSPFLGFRLFTLGLLSGLLALVLGSVGLWRTRPAAGRAGRGRAAAGAGLGLAITAGLLLIVAPAGDLPPINDITTDPEDPPAFSAGGRAAAGGTGGRDLGYPGEAFALQQRRAYPDLEPIALELAANETLERAARVATELGWEITHRDAGAGELEAVAVTRIFRFVDDVIVRVRPAVGGSRVDLRSRSRDGRGDLGANAARIRAFRDAISR